MTPRKAPEDKLKSGQPTKWTPQINEDIVEFFSQETSREREITIRHKNGTEETRFETVANPLPTFEKYAHSINVNGDTIVEWAKPENMLKYPGFSAAYKRAKEKQKDFLVENGLMSLYSTAFAIFTAKNITDMRDKQEVEHSGNAGFILDVTEAKHGNKAARADQSST